MKKSLAIAISGVLLTSAAFTSQAAIEDDLQNICTIVKNNDKSELRKKMKKIRNDYNLRISSYYNGVSCEGVSLIRFAMQNDANDAGEYIIGKMSKSALSEPEADGQTIEQWTQAQGKIKSPLGIALVDRLN